MQKSIVFILLLAVLTMAQRAHKTATTTTTTNENINSRAEKWDDGIRDDTTMGKEESKWLGRVDLYFSALDLSRRLLFPSINVRSFAIVVVAWSQ